MNCTDAGNKLIPVTVEAVLDDQQAGMESSDGGEFAVLDMNGETVQVQLSNLMVFFYQIAFDISWNLLFLLIIVASKLSFWKF